MTDIRSQGDMVAQTINTGTIAQTTNLSLNIIVAGLDRLAELLARPESRLQFSSEQGLEAVAGEGPALPLPANLMEAFRLLGRATDAEPALARRAYCAWLVTHQQRLTPQEEAARHHYIPLAGWVNLQDLPLTLQFTERLFFGQGPERREERRKLTDAGQAIAEHPALALLGPPGSGKSTVLRRLALDTARAVLAGRDSRLPLRLNLAYYTDASASPLEFVARAWRNEGLPGDFINLVRAGEVLLLADGLNEMERLSTGKQLRRANAWRDFLKHYFGNPANRSRAVVASRDQADYSDPLDLPRVEIEPLDATQVEAFLATYLGEQAAAAALAALARLELLAHAGNPYQLSILAALYARHGEALPANRGALFAAYAYWLVEREKEQGHLHWIQTEPQLLALAHLGYQMQARSESTVLSAAELQALLPPSVRLGRETVTIDPAGQFDLACRAGILIPDSAQGGQDPHKFSHQLLQEQFAARQLLARWQAGEALASLWSTPRTPAEMPAPPVGEWDPLPPPPPTGWEQTTLLAAGMTGGPDAFTRAVLAANPTLAGRCLAEGGPQVTPACRAEAQRALLQEMSDPGLHRRARIQAGRTLAALGDPRFEPVEGNGVKVILPEWVAVPAGEATLGSAEAEAYDDEQPVHPVELAGFYLARTPVTNAEYRCFMQTGGYETERYWTPEGWRWRQGESEESGPVEDILEWYRYYRENPDRLDEGLKEGRLMPETVKMWQSLVQMSEEEVRKLALQSYPSESHHRPYYWDDPAYNSLNQPVVGVTWYEAMAYAAWLNEQINGWANEQTPLLADLKSPQGLLGKIRLPTEAEWEWAAGGPDHRRYPWGDAFDPERANTLEGRILRTTPVGAYPAGAADCGALDLSGNVWEWTHSLYRPYPYSSQDGREDPLAGGRRTLRGGAWYDSHWSARVFCRYGYLPDFFFSNFGFRLVVAPILP